MMDFDAATMMFSAATHPLDKERGGGKATAAGAGRSCIPHRRFGSIILQLCVRLPPTVFVHIVESRWCRRGKKTSTYAIKDYIYTK